MGRMMHLGKETQIIVLLHKKGVISLEEFENLTDRVQTMQREEILATHTISIWEGSDGRWKTYLPTHDGKRKLVARVTKAKLEDAIVDHYIAQQTDPLVDELFDSWIERKQNYDKLDHNSIIKYQSDFDQYLSDLAKMRASEINPNQLQEYLREMIRRSDMTRRTFVGIRTILYGVFGLAQEQGKVDFYIRPVIQNMSFGPNTFRKPKSKSEHCFTSDEFVKLCEAMEESRAGYDLLNLSILLLFYIGLRPGELMALRWQDIEGNKIKIERMERLVYVRAHSSESKFEIVPRTKTETGDRIVVVPDVALPIISAMRDISGSEDYIMYDPLKRKKYNSNNLRNRLNRLCRDAGIPLKSPNKIRKSYASTLLDAKIPDHIISKQLGHKSIATTRAFYHKSLYNVEDRVSAINLAFGAQKAVRLNDSNNVE